MLIIAQGYKGRRQLWFNGKQLAYYSFDDHNYALVSTPNNILQMIDSIHAHYDIEFPAVDFLDPPFWDDLVENADSIRYLGREMIDGKDCFHILASNKEKTFQFWINNDAYNLPVRFAITYKQLNGNPQYMASFLEWKVNPHLPIAIFDFLPPPGAGKIRLLAKTER